MYQVTKELNISKHVLCSKNHEGLLKDYYFEDCFFEQCSLINVKLIGCDFKNCIFSMCRMKDCIFEHCNFFATSFIASCVICCQIRDTAFLDCQADKSFIKDTQVIISSGTRRDRKSYSSAVQRLFNDGKGVF